MKLEAVDGPESSRLDVLLGADANLFQCDAPSRELLLEEKAKAEGT